MAASARAVTVVSIQTTGADSLPTTASSNTDLLQTSLASVSPVGGDTLLTGVAKRNGATGTAHEVSATNPATITNSGTYDYFLDIAASPLGCRIDEIDVYTGWSDFRAGQDFQAFFSVVGDASFVFIDSVNMAHSGGTFA